MTDTINGWYFATAKKTILSNDDGTPVYEMYFHLWRDGRKSGRARALIECHRPALAGKFIQSQLNQGREIDEFTGTEIN